MLHHTLPKHGPQLSFQIPGRILVFNSWGHMQNPAYADQDSPCPRIFDKWNLLGVKKTE